MQIRYWIARRKAFTLVELLVVICVFLLMTTALTPFVKMAKDRSSRNRCADNLREISLALHAYASEHDGAFPVSLSALCPNYISNEMVFDCPASKTTGTTAAAEYEYTAGLGEYSPAKAVLVSDRAGNHGAAGKNIVLVDGTIKWAGR